MKERYCLECNEPLVGRADKKFCDDQCRNLFNNKRIADSSKYVRTINNKLKKNRRILMELAPEGKKSVKKELLLLNGFDAQYHTHTYQTKEGAVYRFCYEYGYKHTDEQFILIVRDTKAQRT